MELSKLIELGIAAATKENIPAEYSINDVNETLREELKAFNNYSYYRANKNVLFQLIEEIANVVVPKKVIAQFGSFAEVQHVNVGEKIVFKQRTGVSRGKRFVTVAGEYGTYRTFNVDARDITMSPRVYAGAAILELGDFLCGRVDMSELMDIIIEGLSDSIYKEVQGALKAAINAEDRPAANKATVAGFDAAELDKLINTVSAYGDSVTIYCTKAFASTLYNAPGWVGDANPMTALQDYNDVREMGYVGRYKGTNVVLLSQSFADEDNTETIVDDQYAYIMPAGKEKPVKIGIEGGTLIDEQRLQDGSIEVQAQHMFDVAVVANNYWAIYRNTELSTNYSA
jgi:hypothetical protein